MSNVFYILRDFFQKFQNMRYICKPMRYILQMRYACSPALYKSASGFAMDYINNTKEYIRMHIKMRYLDA